MFPISARYVKARITGSFITEKQAAELLLCTSLSKDDLLTGGLRSRVKYPVPVSLFTNGLFNGQQSWVDENGYFLGNIFSVPEQWPDAEAILDEWFQIAVSFPFLNLSVRLYDENEFLGEIRVADGYANPVYVDELSHVPAVRARLTPTDALQLLGW